jgi:hypothetical protein
MGVFEMVVLLVFIGTAGKVAVQTLARGSRSIPPGEEQRIRDLETELRAAEDRLALTEDRVTDLSEKLAFMEQLLARPEEAARLPGPKGTRGDPYTNDGIQRRGELP